MKTFIGDFEVNQNVSSTFLVKSKEFRNKKAGGQYLALTLVDKTGEVAAHWWDNFEETGDQFEVDDVIFVRGLVVLYRNRLQLTIHRARPCKDTEYDLSDYFPCTKYDVEEMFSSLMGVVASFENRYLRQLIENIFSDAETLRKFKRAPAAKSMHHPYLGGLLEHTLSLVRLVDKVGRHYDGLDIDLLRTGAILHDFGKIDELSYERGINYTNEGQLIGHLAMETIMVSDQVRKIEGFPDELRRQLLHLLLTHHGKLEHGSPKLPATPEALMLAYLDDLDSKIEAMQRLMAEPNIVGDWSRISPMFERPVYRKRTNAPQQIEEKKDAVLNAAAGGRKPVESEKSRPAGNSGFNNPFQQLAEMIKE